VHRDRATKPIAANTPTTASLEKTMAPEPASNQIPNGISAKGAFRYQMLVWYRR